MMELYISIRSIVMGPGYEMGDMSEAMCWAAVGEASCVE